MDASENPASTRVPEQRWYRVTPDRLIIGLLLVECLFWLSERLGAGWHKGYAVLATTSVVGVATVLTGLWFAVALFFRRQFQFSIRSLLVMAAIAALACSWLAWELRKAQEQRDAVNALCGGDRSEFELLLLYDDYVVDKSGNGNSGPAEPAWLIDWLGIDFFGDVNWVVSPWTGRPERARPVSLTAAALKKLTALHQICCLELDYTPVTDAELADLETLHELAYVSLTNTGISDAGLGHLERMAQLRSIRLNETRVTAEGVNRLRCALPNCIISWGPISRPPRSPPGRPPG
jgi:hypothetical protein